MKTRHVKLERVRAEARSGTFWESWSMMRDMWLERDEYRMEHGTWGIAVYVEFGGMLDGGFGMLNEDGGMSFLRMNCSMRHVFGAWCMLNGNLRHVIGAWCKLKWSIYNHVERSMRHACWKKIGGMLNGAWLCKTSGSISDEPNSSGMMDQNGGM